MRILPLIESLKQRFEDAGVGNPKRVAEELIAEVLSCRPLEIYLHTAPLLPKDLQTLETLAGRIETGEPLQYVVGHVDFRGVEIKCDPRALIPRPETEMLVDEVLESKHWKNLIDIGTGSGCIILALAKERPDATFTAVDRSPAALELAQENARIHALEDKIRWIEGSLLDGFVPESCDAVVANLPYISTADWKALDRSVLDHEPQSALDSGPTGMELIEELAKQARTVLVPGGHIFLEYGFDQGEAVFQCLEKSGYINIQIKQDLAHLDRIAIAQNP